MRTFDNTSMFRNKLQNQQQQPLLRVNNLPIGVKNLMYQNLNTELNKIDEIHTYEKWKQLQESLQKNQNIRSSSQQQIYLPQSNPLIPISDYNSNINLNEKIMNIMQNKALDIGLIKNEDPFKVHSGPRYVQNNNQSNKGLQVYQNDDQAGKIIINQKKKMPQVDEDFKTR
ncbi:UNKNOWN [Stylonychia lemnae]|uniref:Uncharacterized protein n=1 Tax=Stylonychia lemnae TaxID=5949 RepID=A0A078B149_STYLE|nr:UNKNOWN [Stylonychia lemnae]|eukprot:CDW88340.1 UNKNOWN [Stylonychia lemnae]